MIATAKTIKKEVSGDRYVEAVGRRKTAIARVRLTPSSTQSILVNDKSVEDYFSTQNLRSVVVSALKHSPDQKFKITVRVSGGGINAQAESIRLGMARCLVSMDIEKRKPLKKAGFLKRDPRAKERRKFGLKKARKSPQWSKR